MNSGRYNRNAFTIIELLVVVGVMTLFLAIIGVALSSGDGSVATQGGQRTLTTMISSARSQAVVNQTNTRLIIHADPPTAGSMGDPRREKYLRFMAVLVREIDDDGNDGWRELNDGVSLPRGVYVVPPAQLNGVTTPAEVISADWDADRRTIVSLDTMQYSFGDPSQSDNDHHYMYIEFSPRGTTSPTTEIDDVNLDRRIVVGPATTTGGRPVFETGGDRNVLGGMIRRNGSFTLVHNPDGFPSPGD